MKQEIEKGKTTQGTSEEGTDIEILPPNKFHLSYYKIINQLLGPPFSTNCKDYVDSGEESQEFCFDLCLWKVVINFALHQLMSVLNRIWFQLPKSFPGL